MPHPDMNEMWNDGHPDEGLLHEWLDEQLSAADAAIMQSHVESCAECQARVAEARGLMAASHRILSALDDVPANVIPTSISANTQAIVGGDVSVNKTPEDAALAGVVPVDAARKVVSKKRAFRWQTIGAVAAVLLAAVTVERAGLLSDDVAVPAIVATEKASEAPLSDAAPSAANASPSAVATTAAPAPPTTAVALAAEPEASKVAAAKSAPPKADIPQIAAAKTAVENARPLPAQPAPPPPAAESRADDVRLSRERIADASRDSRAATMTTAPGAGAAGGAASGAAASLASANAADRSEIEKRKTSGADSSASTPPRAESVAPLQGRIAGARVVLPPEPAAAQRRAASSFAAPAAPTSGTLPFDSLVVVRTVCNPNCASATTLHIKHNGEWRHSSQQPDGKVNVSRGQLMANNLALTNDEITNVFRDATIPSGQVNCNVPATQQAAGVSITFNFGVRSPTRTRPSCTLSAIEVRALAARIEQLAGN